MGQPSRMRTMCRRASVHEAGGGVPQRSSATSWVRRRRGGRCRQSSWNQRTRASAKQTTASQARLASMSTNGNRSGAGVLQSADVVFDVGVGAHVHVEGDGVAGGVGVVTPVAEQQSRGTGVCWAPGCNGSRRTISRVPAGQSDRSTRSVSSATAAPGRSSPSWRSAGCQASSSTAMRLIAAWMLALERATTAKPTLRSRQCHTKSVHPAESHPHLHARDAPGPGRRRHGGRRRSRRAAGRSPGPTRRRDRRSCSPRRCPAATAPPSVSPVASAKQ